MSFFPIREFTSDLNMGHNITYDSHYENYHPFNVELEDLKNNIYHDYEKLDEFLKKKEFNLEKFTNVNNLSPIITSRIITQ